MQQILTSSINKTQSINSILELNLLSKKRPHDFVIIDPRVEDLNTLIRGIKPEATIIVLSLEQDGIQQLDYLIKNCSQIHNLHLITHGTPGNIQLGATELNLATLQQDEATIKSWTSSLADTSLFIYGCNVAQNDTGKIFLQRLHHLTNASIAAATGKVGNSERGGDWDLDYRIGEVEKRSIFIPEIIQTYSGTFDPVVSFTTSPDVLIESEDTVFTYRFELSEPPPEEGVRVTVNGNVPESLNQLDLFAVESEGADFPEGNFDFSGFDINITEQVATLSLPIFNDENEDDNSDAIVTTPEFDDDDFVVTYTLEPGEGYTVDPDANSSTVSFFDTPEDVPKPEPEPEPGDNPDDPDDPIDPEQTIDLFRFRNTTFDTGTYLFVGEEERNDILEDENLSNTFELEGVQEDGTVIPAFTASTEDGDDLAPFYRIQSLDVPGTYLFVSTDEYEAIFAEDSEQQDKWEREGFDEAGEDIPEFYLYEGSADLGTDFNRFQNEQNGTFLYAGPEETNRIESDSNLSNLFTNQGIAFESL